MITKQKRNEIETKQNEFSGNYQLMSIVHARVFTSALYIYGYTKQGRIDPGFLVLPPFIQGKPGVTLGLCVLRCGHRAFIGSSICS
jgi:hypothetical protein